MTLTILDRMRANPRGDWSIQDFETVANQYGVKVTKPKSGGHTVFSHLQWGEIRQIVPHLKPIRAVYVNDFVGLIDLLI